LEEATVLAGGQSLIPLLNSRLARPQHLIDINRIAGVDRIDERDGGLAVQSPVRQAAAEDSDVVPRVCPLLTDAIRLVAHRVIRNRGTVCGSIAHADPASELPAVLLALGGSLVAKSTRGERVIGAGALFAGVFETTLAPDEILVEAWFASSSKPYSVIEESRRHGDFALAGVVRASDRLALFGVAPTPVLADPRDPARGLDPAATSRRLPTSGSTSYGYSPSRPSPPEGPPGPTRGARPPP